MTKKAPMYWILVKKKWSDINFFHTMTRSYFEPQDCIFLRHLFLKLWWGFWTDFELTLFFSCQKNKNNPPPKKKICQKEVNFRSGILHLDITWWRQPLMEDDLWWMTRFNGRQPMEDVLGWETILIKILVTKYQPSCAGGTRSPPAKSKMTGRGPQNRRQGP